MKELNISKLLENTQELKKKKTGYVAIVGRPNAGKSTFINTLIGEKISIVTKVPQTTRNKILAIYNDQDSQIIFFDTPGIHKSNKTFNEEINMQAINSLREAEVILYFIDSSRKKGEEENYIKTLLENVKVPIIKVYTKSDLKPKQEINIDKNTFLISSKIKEGFNKLLEKIKENLEIKTTFFEEDFYTKQNIFFRISEIIREKIFLHTKEEIPHSVFVDVDEIDDGEKLLRIVSYVYTESDSQKYIIIGNKGNLIQKIGTDARIDLEEIFSKKVFLALRVKTKEKWRNNKKLIKKVLSKD